MQYRIIYMKEMFHLCLKKMCRAAPESSLNERCGFDTIIPHPCIEKVFLSTLVVW